MNGKPPRVAALHLCALLLYILLAIGMTLPLARVADHALIATDSNALNDSYLSVWIFGWQAHQLISSPLQLFQGNIFYPFADTLAFSEIILPGALFYLPLALATGNPILAYNLVLIALIALNGFAMYLWALDWLKGIENGANAQPEQQGVARATAPSGVASWFAPAFLAGLVFAFCTYKLGEIRHIQLLSAQFMPLTLMYVARGLRRPTRHNALLTALFFVLNALSSLYYAVFLALAVVLYAVVDFLVRRYRLTRAHIVYGASAALIAALLLLPFVIPFVRLESDFNFSGSRDPRLFAARPASYLAAVPTNWLYGDLTHSSYVAAKGQPLLPGLTVLGLSLIGLAALIRQKKRAWIFLVLLALLGFLLSFGPYLLLDRQSNPALPFPLPYYFASLILTPLKSLNAPARFVVLTMLALSLLTAYGAAMVARRFPKHGALVLVACAGVMMLEFAAVPLRVANVPVGASLSPVYGMLAAQPAGQPVVEVPMGAPTFADQDKYVEYTYNSIYHLQPLVNGYSTFIPPKYYDLVKAMQTFPSEATVRRLKKWGAVWVVVHSDAYKDAALLRTKLDGLDGFTHVQDFGDNWLYRIE